MPGILLAVVLFVEAPAPLPQPTPDADRLGVLARVKFARAANRIDDAERLLRRAMRRWPDDVIFESYFAALLYGTHRLDESYGHMRSVCARSGFEGACATVVAIDLVRGRWDSALGRAREFTETACQRSDRLWTLKQLSGDPGRAVAAAKGLVQAEPNDEISYLALAAAQWRAGRAAAARRTLAEGKRRATVVVLLEENIAW